MASKYLYAVDLTADGDNDRMDMNPYVTARLSDGLRAERQAASHALSKLTIKGLFSPLLIVGIVLTAIGSVLVPCFFETMEGDFGEALRNGGLLLYGGAAALVAGLILLGISFTRRKKNDDDEALDDGALDHEALSPAMQAGINSLASVAERANLELGLPPDDELVEFDNLTYAYKSVAPHGEREVLDEGAYRNDSLFAYRSGDDLVLTDYDTVLTVPVSHIEGYTTVDTTYRVALWLKDEEPDAPCYAAYSLKADKDGLGCRVKGYHRVFISDGIDRYELRVPCYDLPVLLSLVDMRPLD